MLVIRLYIRHVCDCVYVLQLNCCGATGPQDYLYSAWFNHTRDFTGVFVPSTCCRMLTRDPRRPRVVDENLCQVQAIVHGTTKQPITQLHTQVGPTSRPPPHTSTQLPVHCVS